MAQYLEMVFFSPMCLMSAMGLCLFIWKRTEQVCYRYVWRYLPVSEQHTPPLKAYPAAQRIAQGAKCAVYLKLMNPIASKYVACRRVVARRQRLFATCCCRKAQSRAPAAGVGRCLSPWLCPRCAANRDKHLSARSRKGCWGWGEKHRAVCLFAPLCGALHRW